MGSLLVGMARREIGCSLAHHDAPSRGTGEGSLRKLLDYHLRVGQITEDTRIPEGHVIVEQRLDATEVGEGTTVTLIDAKRPSHWTETFNPADCSEYLGLNPYAAGMIGWHVFDAVLTPGDLILLLSWATNEDAEAFENTVSLPEGGRMRRVRIIRDYGMFDRREAPQYFPDASRA